MSRIRRMWAGLLALVLTLGLSAGAAAPQTLETAIADLGRYVVETVAAPQVGSIGGEWAVLALARSGCPVPPGYYEDYYRGVEETVQRQKGNLHEKKYTEYSRLVVTLTALGRDPRKVGGYDLTLPLGDYEKTIAQGLNGPIWALLALDSGNYPVPQNKDAKIQATRQRYVGRILECQLADGGFSLFGGTASSNSGGTSDPDITGMALQALAKYQEDPAVAAATKEALHCMSRQQSDDGGFASWGNKNSESCVQMLVALGELGIPLDRADFVKNGHTLLDGLLIYYRPGRGFLHTEQGDGSNQMATEQGFYALVAARRLRDGENSLYRMGDVPRTVPPAEDQPPAGTGLPGKDPRVLVRAVVAPGKTFDDTVGHKNQKAIETLAARGILSGKTAAVFDPDATVTRCEFAAMVGNSLGLVGGTVDIFADVPPGAWFAPAIGRAYTAGLITGTDPTHFHPMGKVTRQESAVILARAAKLCGVDTVYDPAATRDVLAQFGDYVESAPWARPALAFCYGSGIFHREDLEITPTAPVTRGQVAQMLWGLLEAARLL